MSQIIAITNQKGGVGKTTTSSALVSGLSQLKKRVLGVDLDPQGNLGFSLGVDIEGRPSVYDVFKGTVSTQEAISHTLNGDILSSNILLSSAELEFNRAGREYMLRDLLAPLQDQYDFIIIDTPPALNILTVNAYVAANALMIPMIPEILSLLGITQLKETIDTVKKFYNPNLKILGILLTKYNSRMNLTKEVEELTTEIAKQLGTVILETKIRNSISAAEAPAHGESIITYAPYSNPGFDYARLARQVCEGSL